MIKMQFLQKSNPLFRTSTSVRWHIALAGKTRCNWINASSKNTKEPWQFLRCGSYYRNHINHYADITHILKRLLRKDEPYIWTKNHQNAFAELKWYLQPPILTYIDPNKPHFLFTNASKYLKYFLTQCNYPALVREAFAIYMSKDSVFMYSMQNAPYCVIRSL